MDTTTTTEFLTSTQTTPHTDAQTYSYLNSYQSYYDNNDSTKSKLIVFLLENFLN
jgi:hypothetical protein